MNIAELKNQKEQLEFSLKTKEDIIKASEAKIEGLNQEITSLTNELQSNKTADSNLYSGDVRTELSKKNTLIIAYQEDIDQKKKQLEILDKETMDNQLKMINLESELAEANKKASEPKFYPVLEIKSKQRIFTTFRFIQDKNKEYVLETTNGKERKYYSFEEIEIHLHTTKDNIIVIQWKEKEKHFAFETEFSLAIHENYIKCVVANSCL